MTDDEWAGGAWGLAIAVRDETDRASLRAVLRALWSSSALDGAPGIDPSVAADGASVHGTLALGSIRLPCRAYTCPATAGFVWAYLALPFAAVDEGRLFQPARDALAALCRYVFERVRYELAVVGWYPDDSEDAVLAAFQRGDTVEDRDLDVLVPEGALLRTIPATASGAGSGRAPAS